jgi:predicted nucleotidyltransferase
MDAIPEALLKSILKVYTPKRVVLFGSRARGSGTADSDFDLVVVLDDDAPAETLSWRRRHEARKGFIGSVDIIPCREGVLKSRARAIGSFADIILHEGIVVYDRD